MLTQYFALNRDLGPRAATQYTYFEAPHHFTWKKNLKTWDPKADNREKIVRIGSVSPANRELYVRYYYNF